MSDKQEQQKDFGDCPRCGSDDSDVSYGPDDGITWITVYRFYCFKCKKTWYDAK
jgi:transposase-like protein